MSDETNTEDAGGVVVEQLQAVIEKVERLEEEKQGIGADIRELYGAAKANGFDVKTLRAIVQLRKLDPATRSEQKHLLNTYMRAIGLE